MKLMTTAEAAEKWGVSERSVRNYCASGRVPGAFIEGKTWRIPEGSKKPARKAHAGASYADLLTALKEQKAARLPGGIYHRVQIDLTYSSNHIEGSSLTHDQTRFIFETNTLGVSGGVRVDDVLETANHFRCIDMVIDAAKHSLSERFIKQLHLVLKNGTADSRRDWFAVGDYKRLPNEIGGRETVSPENVPDEMRKLLREYNAKPAKTLDDLLDFHYRFERIHPFQDGNGRIGRLILFKECLKNGIIPFIITDDLKFYYYQGLRNWETERGFLRETCLTAQDRFKRIMEYHRIKT